MREFLKGLELDKDVVEQIMTEYGKHITNSKDKENDYKEEITNLKSQINDLKSKNVDYEGQISEMTQKLSSNEEALKNLETMTNENSDLKAQIQMNGSNVKKEFSKFVASEVKSLVNDETDFATALENYKQENPQYFGETIVKKVQTSPILSGGEQQPQTTNSIMNDIIRGAKNDN
jgi:chromosome segregation ATPase